MATPFASTAHFSLLAALDDAGVDATTVDIIDAAPDDIYAAWVRGDIDAAYVWNPNLAKLIADGGNVLITSADLAALGKTTYDLAIVSNEFADEFPAAVELWLTQQDRAIQLINDDPDAAAEARGARTRDHARGGRRASSPTSCSSRPPSRSGPTTSAADSATNLFAAAEFNKAQGTIDTVQPEDVYAAGVDDSFALAVADVKFPARHTRRSDVPASATSPRGGRRAFATDRRRVARLPDVRRNAARARPASTSTCPPARSCASSGRAAAARRRCCN